MNPPPSREPMVSIVIATHARCDHLRRCLQAIRQNVGLDCEIIVVGSGAGDGTEDWLCQQRDVRFIKEAKREGATRAYNKGFRAATGRFVMWLNDDSYPLSGAVEAAVALLERPDLTDVGMVAFYHNWDRRWNRLDSLEHNGTTFSIYNVRGYPYANFGLLRRALLRELGYLDETYYFCAWDPDLSLKIQRQAGLKVVGCRQALIYHEEHVDDRKRADSEAARADNARLFAKWNLPDRFAYPDPAFEYQQLIRDRALA
jgi:GT2 family glycosyltransferase